MPIQGQLELVKSTVFDTVVLPENLRNGKSILFSIPMGQWDGRKCKQQEDTSMLMACCLPCPQKFLVRKLRFGLFDSKKSLSLPDAAEFDFRISMRTWCSGFAAAYQDATCWKDAIKNCKYTDPETKKYGGYFLNDQSEISLFERCIAGQEHAVVGKPPWLIETMECFTLCVKFPHDFHREATFVAALEGICARAIC